jgi:hypothetical protein
MKESIVDDVKFKDHIPDFKNNNDDDFPKWLKSRILDN